MSKPGLREWPADKVERWPLDRIKDYPRNPKAHSPENIKKIAASMERFGVTNPVLVDEQGVLIFGHGRRQAAALLGYTELPVSVARGWSEDEKAAYRVADNQLANLDGWDYPALKAELLELDSSGFDMPLLGFDGMELKQLMANPQNVDPDEIAPDPPAQPVMKRGDLWILGEHRLLCGDATSAEDVARLFNGARPHLMVTDPPYGVDYDPFWRHEANAKGLIWFSAKRIGKVNNDDRIDWSDAWKLFPGDVVYCWHASKHASNVQISLEQNNFEVRSQIIWAKDSFSISRGNYHWQHEPCWYSVRRGSVACWMGGHSQSTLWRINKFDGMDQGGHGTQKPIECMRRPIENNSAPGGCVYDPFVGTGTTIIAAELTGRRCFALEIDPGYCDVSVRRWEKISGKVAQKESAPEKSEALVLDQQEFG